MRPLSLHGDALDARAGRSRGAAPSSLPSARASAGRAAEGATAGASARVETSPPRRGGHAGQRLTQALEPDRLDEVVGGRHLERLERVLAVGGDEDHGRGSLGDGQRFREVQPAEAGHLDVEEDDVVLDGGDQLERFRRAARLADDLDAARLFEQEAQLGARGGFVVDDQRFRSGILASRAVLPRLAARGEGTSARRPSLGAAEGHGR